MAGLSPKLQHFLNQLEENDPSLTTLWYAYVVYSVRVCQLPCIANCPLPLFSLFSSLTENNIGDAGAEVLGKALLVNTTLTTLEYVFFVRLARVCQSSLYR